MGQDVGNVIGALKNVGISDQQQDPGRRAFDQTASGLEDRDAGAFGPDQGAGNIETIFRQQEIEVVA